MFGLFVCSNVFQEHREEDVGSAQEGDRVELKSSHRSSTPTPSYTHQDEQAESQASEEQPVQQEEEEAPNNSHLDIRGERELQAYNILKDRTFGHTWEFDADLLEKTGMNAEFTSV